MFLRSKNGPGDFSKTANWIESFGCELTQACQERAGNVSQAGSLCSLL